LDNNEALVNQAFFVLSKYNECSDVITEDDGVCFVFNEKKYKVWMFDDRYSLPLITAADNNDDYPHYLCNEWKFKGETHRLICLFEENGYVNTILSIEEKIKMVVDRLIELGSLSRAEIENEFQKEFPLYWDAAVRPNSKSFNLYLSEDNDYAWLQQFTYKFETRVAKGLDMFNDAKNSMGKNKIPALFVKITDKSGLLPPLSDKPWDARKINEILNGAQVQRISPEAHKELLRTSYSYKSLLLIFNFDVYYFACEVEFKNPGTEKLIRKIEKSIVGVSILNINRCDFRFLSQQIGNDDLLLDKTVLVVGAGSLGSYVAEELIKAGCKTLTIADGDRFEPQNLLRHKLPFRYTRIIKSEGMSVKLQSIHPEISVKCLNTNLSADDLENELSSGIDCIIFTIGKSDTQLKLNQFLHGIRCAIPVIYSWLEGDGMSSHSLCVSYKKQGCFECLFTDDDGNMVNNKVNMAANHDVRFLRGSCGGARVAYGSSTLLTATRMTLTALRRSLSDPDFSTCLHSFTGDNFTSRSPFFSMRCRCCDDN